MSAAGGPRLEGIGRGGDSNLVLCVDAHDAGSYPGEPTTNLFPQPSLASSAVGSTWSGTNGTWGTSTATVENVMGPDGKFIKAVSNQHTASGGGTAHIWFAYSSLSGMGSAQRDFTLTNGTAYTCSWWWKAINSRWAIDNNIYFNSPAYGTTTDNLVTTEWTKAYVYFTFGGTTGSAYSPTHYFYDCGDGFKVWYAMLQIEEKTYGTPAVRSQLSGFSQQGYNARPASVNLMIHGDVGTGTSFEDSSPSKHTITTSGNTTHSSAQSKFSGGSIYFDGTGDYLTIADHADWTFGTGDFTIDLWIYPTTIGSGGNKNYIGTNPNQYLAFASNYSGGLLFYYGNGSWTSTPAATSNVVVNDAWQHVAVSRSGGTVYLFHNGVLITSRSQSTSIDPPNIEIGAYGGGASDLFVGYMDEVRITKGTALWTHAFTPPTRRNLNGPVVDLSGYNNAGNFTTKAMTDVKTYQRGQVIEPVASAVWDFDGTDDYISCGNGSSLNFGTGDFTIGFWVNITDWVSSWAWPVSKAPGYSGMFIALTSPGYFRASLGAWFTDVIGSYSSEPAISFGTWYHFTLKRASGSVTAYLNGNQYGTSVANTYDLGTESANSFNIGLGPAASSLTNGRFAAVQAYKTALTAQQVKQNFNSQRSRFKV